MSKDTNTLLAAMSAHEKRAVGIIALIAMFRMFGLFALLPVLSLHAAQLAGATPVLIGLAVGALLYPRGERGRFTRGLRSPPALGILAGWPGRRSLPIYLVHQLILIPLVAIGLLTAGVDLDTDGFS